MKYSRTVIPTYSAFKLRDITRQEARKELGIEENPDFIPRLNEIKKKNAEVEQKTEEELRRLNDRSNNGNPNYDPEMDPNGGMSDEQRHEAAFKDTVDGMNGSELLSGQKTKVKRI